MADNAAVAMGEGDENSAPAGHGDGTRGNWVVTRKENVIQSAKNGDVMRSNVIYVI